MGSANDSQDRINAGQQGFYANETEVVRDAVRRLREQKEAQQTQFYRAVMKGHRQIEQGLTVSFSRELLEQIDSEAVEKVKNGEKITYDPDVIPPENDQ